jgi:hypothetical protein
VNNAGDVSKGVMIMCGRADIVVMGDEVARGSLVMIYFVSNLRIRVQGSGATSVLG